MKTHTVPIPTTQSSSKSQVLKTTGRCHETPTEKWKFKDNHGTPFRISIALSQQAQSQAQWLVQRMYIQRGYTSTHAPKTEHVLLPFKTQTLTLLIEDASGVEAGTVSLVFDGPLGLPSDEIYAHELNKLRAKGRRLVEVTALAIHDRNAKSKAVLVQLFNFISIYARRIRQSTDFVVSVNPRHTAFYRRLLEFKLTGSQRPCPRVNCAPAVLLSLDLNLADPENRKRFNSSPNRTLYPHFSSLEEEREIASFLKKSFYQNTCDTLP